MGRFVQMTNLSNFIGTFSLSHLPIIVPVPIPIFVHLDVCGWWWQRGFSRCLAAIKLDFISLHFQIIMISSELWWTHLDSILCPMEPTSRPSADTIGGIHYWCILHTVYHKLGFKALQEVVSRFIFRSQWLSWFEVHDCQKCEHFHKQQHVNQHVNQRHVLCLCFATIVFFFASVSVAELSSILPRAPFGW